MHFIENYNCIIKPQQQPSRCYLCWGNPADAVPGGARAAPPSPGSQGWRMLGLPQAAELLLHTKLYFVLYRAVPHLDPYTNLFSQEENASKAFINHSHARSCPGESLVSRTTIWINSSLLIIWCAQSQHGTEVFLYTDQLRAHSGHWALPFTKAHQGQTWNLDLGWSPALPSGPDTFLLCPPREPTSPHCCPDLPPELCFRQKHAVTGFKTLQYRESDSSQANSSCCVHTVPLGSWFPLSECQILHRY